MPPTLVTVAPEILLSIAKHLPQAALNALIRSNRRLYHDLLLSLYARAVTDLPFQFTSRRPWTGTVCQLELCLAAGLDPNKVIIQHPYEQRLLHRAEYWDWDRAVVQLLLDHDADVNARDKCDYTPLHYFLQADIRPLSSLELLLQRGADVNAVTCEGKTPLHCTLSYASCCLEIVEMLLEFGADPKALDGKGKSPLQYLAWMMSLMNPLIEDRESYLQELGDISRLLDSACEERCEG